MLRQLLRANPNQEEDHVTQSQATTYRTLTSLPNSTRIFTTWDVGEMKKNGPRQRASYHYWHRIRSYLAGLWPEPEPSRRLMSTSRDLEAWWNDSERDEWFVIDTEYSTPGPKLVYIVGLYSPSGGVLQWEAQPNYVSTDELTALYTNLIRTKRTVMQHYKADIGSMYDTFGIEYRDYLKGIDDTVLMHHVLYTEMPHDLGFLESLHGKHEKAKHLRHIDELRYNAFDCITTARVYQSLMDELDTEPGCMEVYRNELLRLIPIVLRMEARGIPINQSYVRDAFDATSRRIHLAQELADSYAGFPINLDSSDQLGAILFQSEDVYEASRKLGASLRKKKTDKGALSLADEAVTALRQAFEPIDQDRDSEDWDYVLERIHDGDAHPLLEARSYFIGARQNRSSYILPLVRTRQQPLTNRQRLDLVTNGLRPVHDIVRRIYPEFNIHTQATGRWSTVNPPLAQLPKSYRDILANDWEWPEYYWDWDQVELRIITALSGDEAYQEWFANEWDPHTLAACDCLSIPYPPNRTKYGIFESKESTEWRAEFGVEDDNWLPRQFAKTFIYRLCYRGEAKYAGDVRGARQLGLDARGLELAAERWLKRHPAVRRLWQSLDHEILTTRCIRNVFGRRRILLSPDVDARIREGSNFPVQSVVGHMMNRHIIEVYEASEGECVPLWTKHDQVNWAIHRPYYEEGKALIKASATQDWDLGNISISVPASFVEREVFQEVA